MKAVPRAVKIYSENIIQSVGSTSLLPLFPPNILHLLFSISVFVHLAWVQNDPITSHKFSCNLKDIEILTLVELTQKKGHCIMPSELYIYTAMNPK